MGTMLHQKGVTLEQSFDAINYREPAVVAAVHRAYIDAGADVIETNSFGANRYKLAEFGLQNEVKVINQTAVSIARRVIEGSFKPVLLAGSVGPLGGRLAPLGRIRPAEAKAAFSEQIEALLAPPDGVDFLILETMSDVKEVATAVSAARAISTDIPIVVQMTFTRDNRTLLGYSAEAIADEIKKLDIDVLGVNCSGGPAQVLRLILRIKQSAENIPLAASPNAGWPEQTEGGRVNYTATADYFADYATAFKKAGVGLIGGCCGTSEAHIAAMRQALNAPTESTASLPNITFIQQEERPLSVPDQPTQLATYLQNGTFVSTVEMSPPKGIITKKMLQGARMLKGAGANILNIADNPLARMRMSAWAAAYLTQQEIKIETILHFPTRGRNLLRIQADLLAAHAMGIRNLFVTMGDPTRIGDYPEAMDSYDIVPTGLIHLIKQQFNQGVDKAGSSIDQPTHFTVGCALSLEPKNLDRELKLFNKKIRHGADFALTQPVFNPTAVPNFINAYQDRYNEPVIPIIVGIKPLYNGRNAEFLHHEVPGISIPDTIREQIKSAQHPQQVGVQIAQEIIAAIQPHAQGIYMMPAFGRYDLVADVLDILQENKK